MDKLVIQPEPKTFPPECLWATYETDTERILLRAEWGKGAEELKWTRVSSDPLPGGDLTANDH